MNKIDVLSKINEGMRAVLAKEDELAGNANDTSAGFEQMRLNYTAGRAYWVEGGPEMAEKVDCKVEGPHGDIPVRLYYPVKDRASLANDGETLPAIVYAHGGGFVLGNLDTHDRICRVLASKTGAAVAAVDYRLSPEAKFPVAVQEVACVAKHLHEHGAEEGIDGDDLSFAGDSGGAVLSMASNLWLRDEEGDNSFVKSLLLYYGFYGLEDSVSQRLYGWDIDGMRKEDLIYYNECWLNDLATETKAPYVDMFHNDLTTSMPVCYIAAAGLDPLRDDSELLHRVLDTNGVRNQHEVFEGVLHAFVHYSRMLDEAAECIEHSAEFWKTRHQA